MKERSKLLKIIIFSVLSLFLIVLVFYGRDFDKASTQENDDLQIAKSLHEQTIEAYKNDSAEKIELDDKTITINRSGIYHLSGSLNQGQVVIDCLDTVALILDNVEISNSENAAISINNAKHTLIYLAEGSDNKLVNGIKKEIVSGESNNETGAVIYARDSLSIAGNGKLTIEGYINNAITSTDRLFVFDGELKLLAMNNGLKGKDQVDIYGGMIDIECGNDGIKANDETSGSVLIHGGKITIKSFGDGVDAYGDLVVEDGTINIQAGEVNETTLENTLPDEYVFFDDIVFDENGVFDISSQLSEAVLARAKEVFGNVDVSVDQIMACRTYDELIKLFEINNDRSFNDDMRPIDPPDGSFGNNDFDQRPLGDMMGRPDRFNDEGDRNNMFPKDNNRQPFMQGDPGNFFDADNNKETSTTGVKGLKCDGNLSITNGDIDIKSSDDCIHAGGDISVYDGLLILYSGDDAMHSDGSLRISDGDITITSSYEGIEGQNVYIDGGMISVKASDDGINAGGDSMQLGDNGSLPLVKISGGSVYVNADGDGIDSNGDLIIDGGSLIIDGPENSGNSALDSGSENGGQLVCNGGVVLAIGSSDMLESFNNSSTQLSFIKTVTQSPSGSKIIICDEDSNVLIEHVSAKSFDSIIFSSNDLVSDGTYFISVNDYTESVSPGNMMSQNFNGKGKR